MEFSWTICVVAVLANLAWIALMAVTQFVDIARGKLPPRNSLIPGTRQRFLHMQDFWTMTYGDIVGVSFIWVAFSTSLPIGLEFTAGHFSGLLPFLWHTGS